MGGCKADLIRERFNELLNEAIDDIATQLNDEFDEVIYVRNGEIYVDCSDFSQIDVKIS